MENKKTALMVVAILVFVCIAVLIVYSNQASIQNGTLTPLELNQSQLNCYKNLLYAIQQEANITSQDLNVKHAKCSQGTPYSQMEMSGTYFDRGPYSRGPKEFYFLRINWGMAPSGADGHEEVCLIIGNKTNISRTTIGRESEYQGPARCSWQPKLP